MLKIKHRLLSSLIVAAPLLLNTGVITTTVHASPINSKSCTTYKTSCKSTKANNCVNVKYDCSKLVQSICSGTAGSVFNCIK